MTPDQMKLFVKHLIESEELRRSWNSRIESWNTIKHESGLWKDDVVKEEWDFEQI